jgi:hypothetical protein
MGIMNTDRTLPANKLIFEVRRDAALRARFRDDLEGLMRDYGLSAVEQKALREIDLQKLSDLGVHPYFLPQVSRLFKGAGYNHNESAAAQLYAEKMLRGK